MISGLSVPLVGLALPQETPADLGGGTHAVDAVPRGTEQPLEGELANPVSEVTMDGTDSFLICW